MLYALDLIGVFVAAVSGGLAGRQKGMDWFGTFVVGVITGVGGGTLRSMLIGDVPPVVLRDPSYFIAAGGATVVAWLAGPLWCRIRRIVSLVDAVSLGVFVSIGVRISQEHGLQWWACIALGVITGTFGGVLRDVVRAEVPLIFRKEIYATAGIIGGAALLGLDALKVEPDTGMCIATVVVTAIRMLAIRYSLNQSEL
ncbi:trimeric intracellular cation channel family protein [Luteolibacter sp. LG18]|uniref:trimeric intracellular cation channel family protein n=1 Tax=Luteolibacter sp. LG18 TaxID=2819286 RepID=UPI002B2EAE76|nr:membrane protein [Luteolibacter sp. LG18]